MTSRTAVRSYTPVVMGLRWWLKPGHHETHLMLPDPATGRRAYPAPVTYYGSAADLDLRDRSKRMAEARQAGR